MADVNAVEGFNAMLREIAKEDPEMQGVTVSWVADAALRKDKGEGWMEVPVILSNGKEFSFDVRLPKDKLN